jgi:hypothetical protein
MKLKHDLNIEVFDYNNQPIDVKIDKLDIFNRG